MDCAFPADSEGRIKGDPETRVNSPRVVSTLKTEIEALTAGEDVPWFSTNRNWPAESVPTLIGVEVAQGGEGGQIGLGGIAVPTGVSVPVWWLRVYPDTVLEVEFATYTRLLFGCRTMATGI